LVEKTLSCPGGRNPSLEGRLSLPPSPPVTFTNKFVRIFEEQGFCFFNLKNVSKKNFDKTMEKFSAKVILSHSKDNVATARSPIEAGAVFAFPEGKNLEAKEDVPFGHKIALRRIKKGGVVIKYGERIGRAVREIKPGEWVHIHNVAGERGRGKGRRKG
jgi:altronate dehydratase